jgi:hypothetical protein
MAAICFARRTKSTTLRLDLELEFVKRSAALIVRWCFPAASFGTSTASRGVSVIFTPVPGSVGTYAHLR